MLWPQKAQEAQKGISGFVPFEPLVAKRRVSVRAPGATQDLEIGHRASAIVNFQFTDFTLPDFTLAAGNPTYPGAAPAYAWLRRGKRHHA